MGEDSASCTKLNIPTCRVQTSQGLALDITRRGFALGCLALQCSGARPGALPGYPAAGCPVVDKPRGDKGVSWTGDDLVKPTEPEPEPPPTVCPFCRSARISIPNEKVSASTYWRCDACGQMWNVKRHTASLRSPYDRRWNS